MQANHGDLQMKVYTDRAGNTLHKDSVTGQYSVTNAHGKLVTKRSFNAFVQKNRNAIKARSGMTFSQIRKPVKGEKQRHYTPRKKKFMAYRRGRSLGDMSTGSGLFGGSGRSLMDDSGNSLSGKTSFMSSGQKSKTFM